MGQIRSNQPIARKQHNCDWCDLPVVVGEKYENSTYEYYGEIFTWKNHISCGEIATKLKMFESLWDEGLSGEFFQEAISDEYCKLKPGDPDFKWPDFSEQLSFVKKHHLKIKYQ